MKTNAKKILAVTFQIVLLVGAIISFSHSVGEAFSVVTAAEEEAPASLTETPQPPAQTPSSSSNEIPTNLFSDFLIALAKTKGFGGLPDMNAINPQQILQNLMSSIDGGVSVCTKTKDNKLCQTYSKKDCEEVCAGRCVQISSLDSSRAYAWPEECKLGICLDEEAGACEPQSPWEKCVNDGGEWLGPESNDARCRKGCCFLGDQGKFVTEQQCRADSAALGMDFGTDEAKFDGQITNELECLALAEVNADEKGACTFSSAETEKKECLFVTYGECNSRGGEFHADKLCSHPELNTICEKQKSTVCDEELNAIYWYDSCGNRENIFDSSKEDDGWNNGEVLSKSESCSVARGNNRMANQETCGNCFYPAGTKCLAEISDQELNDAPDGNVVCRDLACVDSTGERRENGESWCAYQGKVGNTDLDIPFLGAGSQFLGKEFGPLADLLGGQRARDTPGSNHYRLSCFEGEIIEEMCEGYRNSICVEEDGEGEFSQAVCRANRWQECLSYNPTKSKGGIGKIQVIASMFKCEQDPDCFVKYVNVDKDFSFPVCVPKYPPGFDQDNLDSAEQICSYASQMLFM